MEKIKEEWIEWVSTLEITAEQLYDLIHPSDKAKYFELVDKLTELVFKLKYNGSVDTQKPQQFKKLAILYLLEFEKEQNKLLPGTNDWVWIETNPYPISVQPLTNPVSPGTIGSVYCSSVTTTA